MKTGQFLDQLCNYKVLQNIHLGVKDWYRQIRKVTN